MKEITGFLIPVKWYRDCNDSDNAGSYKCFLMALFMDKISISLIFGLKCSWSLANDSSSYFSFSIKTGRLILRDSALASSVISPPLFAMSINIYVLFSTVCSCSICVLITWPIQTFTILERLFMSGKRISGVLIWSA